MFTRILPVTLIAAGLLTLATATAQNETPQPPTKTDKRDATTPQPVSTARNSANDAFLATFMLIGNENEIAIAQLAQQRATDAEVKAFAQKMIDEHKQMVEKLRPLAATSDLGVGAKPATPAAPTGERDVADASGMRQPPIGSLDHVQLFRDLGRKCLETTKRELDQKQGAEFDRCYMFMAVAAHTHTADTLDVFRNYSSDKLATVITDAQKTVKAHLDHAKQLAKKLEAKSTPADKDKTGKDPMEGSTPPTHKK